MFIKCLKCKIHSDAQYYRPYNYILLKKKKIFKHYAQLKFQRGKIFGFLPAFLNCYLLCNLNS